MSLNDALLDVEFEQPHRCLCFSRDWLDHCSSKDEVILPTLAPWVEQAHVSAARRGDRAYVGPFPGVTTNTSVGKVIRIGAASMFAADNVIYLMRRIRVSFVEETIFTAISCAFRDESSQRVAYVIAHAGCAGAPAPSP